jgi:hypothetical protein
MRTQAGPLIFLICVNLELVARRYVKALAAGPYLPPCFPVPSQELAPE